MDKLPKIKREKLIISQYQYDSYYINYQQSDIIFKTYSVITFTK